MTTLSEFYDQFAAMPIGQLVLLGMSAATWLAGGNILVAMHYKRMGKHWASGFRPFAFPFNDFNKAEWLALSCLAFVALSFGALGINYGK